jgi:ankyrin repeat protein
MPALLAAVMAMGLSVPSPAGAQISEGHKFLEAVRKKDVEATFAALDRLKGDLVNTRDEGTGDTALHIVVRERELPWMRFLVERGAKVDARNARGETPLAVASTLGFGDGVALLLAARAHADEADNAGETPLMMATHRGDAAIARALLGAGADPRRSDNSGRSALDYARLGRANPVLAEIETFAKARASTGPQRATYGPTP